MQIFGKRFDAPAFDEAVIVWTPLGMPCLMCGEAIEPGDSGVMMPTLRAKEDRVSFEPEHIECHMRSACGSVEHLQGHKPCTCRALAEGESYREQARRVMAYLIEQRAEHGESVWLAHL